MTDKMPTNVWIEKHYVNAFDEPSTDDELEYTIKHNNPDYHVIPKSDVDGDVMGALDSLNYCIESMSRSGKADINQIAVWSDGNFDNKALTLAKLITIRNALIAQSVCVRQNAIDNTQDDLCTAEGTQSDPDTVRIPRKVLEGMKWKEPGTRLMLDEKYHYTAKRVNQAINNVLNYKEGDDDV